MASIPNGGFSPQPTTPAQDKPNQSAGSNTRHAAWDAAEERAKDRDPSLGFHRNHEEKAAAEQRTAKMFEDHRKAEEASLEKERIKAGAPIINRDAGFASRTPRDILRRAPAILLR